MDYIYIVFKSRQDALFITDALRQKGINAQIVSTPKSFKLGCGLSVKVGSVFVAVIKNALQYYRPKSFKGLFYVKNVGNQIFIKSL